MRLRQLVLACGLTSFVLSPYVSALGLGEVKLKSSLNQPLEAEVKLLDTRDLTAEQILVTLASPVDFERNGVERLYFYTELQFQVDLESPDGPKVIIKSRSPVREPYLNFLIEARWTAGRLLREYTLLMDLPTFDEEAAPASVTSAPSVRPQESTAPAAVPRAVPSAGSSAPSTRAPVAPKPSLSGDEYEVRANDTLWEIALRARADSSVSVHQSMMALYRANPEAFINGNINKLRRGQVLRVPDTGDMKSVGKTEALGQFAQASGDSELGAQLNASRRTSAARSESAEVSGRVKLAAPSSRAENVGQGSGANDGAGKALESELAATLEELDKSKSENTELGVRVKDLESQIETMERLVAVSNEKLRALQVAAGETVAVAESSAGQSLQASSAGVVAEVAAASQAASSAAAAKPIPPTKPLKVVPVAEPTLVDTLKNNALLIGLASLGVVGGAGAFVAYRRRKAAAEQQTDETEDVFAMDDMIGEQDEPLINDESNAELTESSLFDEDVETTAVAETGDVVGEADIYIAYGKLDQAEEMLLNALQKDPASTDIRMKLLEVYSQQQNAPAFDKQYAALLPIAGAALIVRANELREGIAGVDAFVESGTDVIPDSSVSVDIDEFALDDFELDDQIGQGSALESSALVSEADDELDFDFDLNLDDDSAPLQSLSSDGHIADVDEFDFALDDAVVGASSEDDLSELSLALDDLDHKALPVDVEATVIEADDEFNFDFDDELQLLGQKEEGSTAAIITESSEPLDVIADDFNLDMNVDDVDLAALDHEMESLDVDFDDDLTADAGASIAEFASTEIAKDESEIGLDLDDDTLPLHEVEEFDLLDNDVVSTGLVLTDDLDRPAQAQDVAFELNEELLELDSDDFEAENLGSLPVAELLPADSEDDFVVDFDDEELASLDAELNLSLADVDLSDAVANVDAEKFDVLEDELDLSEEAFDLDSKEGAIDLDLLNDELASLDDPLPSDAVEAVAEAAVDLELDDEIPELKSSFAQAEDEGEDLGLAAFAATTDSVPEEVLPELEEEHEEDLFAEALSDFGNDNDEIDLNNFNSDEAALADLSDDDMDSELDFLAEADEAATKLDLARAYIDMGDADGAKDILSEVVHEGNDAQRQEANELLSRIV